jgi:hypothetical protein
VSDPTDYEIIVQWNAELEAQTVTAGELRLLRAFLPDVLKELAAQIQKEEE